MTEQHPGPTTIDDVAKAAGVSTATVSRALRNHPYVADATRAKVVEAATRLRYVANPNAARLASGATSTIGLLAPVLTSWYTSEVVAGVVPGQRLLQRQVQLEQVGVGQRRGLIENFVCEAHDGLQSIWR